MSKRERVPTGRGESDHWVHIEESPRRVHVTFGGETIADSKHVLLLREAQCLPVYYFPKRDVRMEQIEPSATTSRCPYKGVASYWSVRVKDRVFKDIVWSYLEPIPECPKVKGLLSFFQERAAAIYVDGEPVPVPKTRWSRESEE